MRVATRLSPNSERTTGSQVSRTLRRWFTSRSRSSICGTRLADVCLAPMLRNEVQQQAAEISDLRKLVAEMLEGLLKLQSKHQR